MKILPLLEMKRWEGGILRLKDIMTSEEEDAKSQDFMLLIDHGHVQWKSPKLLIVEDLSSSTKW